MEREYTRRQEEMERIRAQFVTQEVTFLLFDLPGSVSHSGALNRMTLILVLRRVPTGGNAALSECAGWGTRVERHWSRWPPFWTRLSLCQPNVRRLWHDL